MHTFDQNEVSLINDITHKIYTIEQIDNMREKVLTLIRFLIPYKGASFYLGSAGNENYLERPVGAGIPDKDLQKYLEEYEAEDYTKWIFVSAKSMAYRETDLFTDEIRQNSRYFKEWYGRGNIYYSAQLSLVWQEQGNSDLPVLEIDVEAYFSLHHYIAMPLTEWLFYFNQQGGRKMKKTNDFAKIR